MKKLNLSWMLIALMGIFASCSEDDSLNAVTGGEGGGMTFTVGTDFGAQTRAGNPTIPAGRKLRYVMEVYVDGAKSGSQTVKYVSDASEQVTFNVPKQTAAYKCVFWADFYDDADATNNAFSTDNLTNVTTRQDKPVEAYEAFYAVTAEIAPGTITAQTVTLKHAVARVNVLTTNTIKDCRYAKINYEGGNAFNALTGEASDSRPITFGATITNTAATPTDPYTLHTFYFLAPAGKQQLVTVSGTLHESADKTTDVIRSFKVANVPFQSNYVTNLKGAFGVEAGINVTVSCDADWSATPNEPFIWDGTLPAENTSYAYSGGAGTEVSPYEIGNLKDFVQFIANETLGSSYGNCYKLTADIDLAGVSMPAMYAPALFDGNKHTIRGVYNTFKEGDDGTGLFGMGASSTIKDLHVEGTVVGGVNATGGILGWDEEGNCVITGCSFKGTVSGAGNVGGIAGICNTLTACKFMGEVIGDASSDREIGVGGVIGMKIGSNSVITACYNTGTIIIGGVSTSQKVSVGGIVGSMYDVEAIVKASYNIGTIELNGYTGKTDDINGPQGKGYTGKPAYVANDGTTSYFGRDSWPANQGDWQYRYDADGTAVYWKSLGLFEWNKYPILWWEETVI